MSSAGMNRLSGFDESRGSAPSPEPVPRRPCALWPCRPVRWVCCWQNTQEELYPPANCTVWDLGFFHSLISRTRERSVFIFSLFFPHF